MANKAEPQEKQSTGDLWGAGSWVLVILKVLFVFLLTPLVAGMVAALLTGVGQLDARSQEAVLAGVWVYVLMKFFVYDFDAVYKFGQGMVGACFQFLKPVMNFAPYVIPIYTVIAVIAYVVLNLTGKLGAFGPLWMGVIAFTFTMHIVLTAQDLYAKDQVFAKPNYFSSMGLVFIVDVFFIALLINLASKGFSFVEFFQALSATSGKIYMLVFNQLFVR